MTTLLPHEDTNLFQVKAGADMVFDATLVATDDLRYLPPQLELFASRHDPAANTMLLDREIADRFKTNFTALMYHLELESGGEEHGANHSILLKAISLEIVRPIFANRQAIELEDELFIFYESSDAVLAVLEAKAAIRKYNSELPSDAAKNKLTVHGWGIHQGTMIFVEGTDIHWGDPVNTASKLGQDLATNNDLLISSVVHGLSKDHHEIQAKGVVFESRLLKRSNVDFPCFSVSIPGDGSEDKAATPGEESDA